MNFWGGMDMIALERGVLGTEGWMDDESLI